MPATAISSEVPLPHTTYDDDVEARLLGAMGGGVMVIGFAAMMFYTHGLSPQEGFMKWWECLCTMHHPLFHYILPTLYQLISWVFVGSSQSSMPASFASPPNTSNASYVPAAQSFAPHHFQVLGVTPTPETVLGILVNNTLLQQAFMTLLATQTSTTGCSATAEEVMRLLKLAGITVGNFVCNLWFMGQQLMGNCSYAPNLPGINPINGTVCTATGPSLPPGSAQVIIANDGGIIPYLQVHHKPSAPMTMPPTGTKTDTSTTPAPITLTSTSPAPLSTTDSTTGTGTGTNTTTVQTDTTTGTNTSTAPAPIPTTSPTNTGTNSTTDTGTGTNSNTATPTGTNTATSTTPAPTTTALDPCASFYAYLANNSTANQTLYPVRCNNSENSVNLAGKGIGVAIMYAIAPALNFLNLTTLNLGEYNNGNNLNAASMLPLADTLKGQPNLKSLSLGKNPIGVSGIQTLVSAFPQLKKLDSLNVCQTSLGDAGMIALSAGLPLLPLGSYLDLAFNGIGDSGALAFAAIVPNITHLQTLMVHCNSIGNNGMLAIARAFQNNRFPFLRTAWFGCGNSINTTTHNIFVAALPNVTDLGL